MWPRSGAPNDRLPALERERSGKGVIFLLSDILDVVQRYISYTIVLSMKRPITTSSSAYPRQRPRSLRLLASMADGQLTMNMKSFLHSTTHHQRHTHSHSSSALALLFFFLAVHWHYSQLPLGDPLSSSVASSPGGSGRNDRHPQRAVADDERSVVDT